MRKFYWLAGAFVALCWAGCATDSVCPEPESPAVVADSHFVSQEEALEHLACALEAIDVPETRASGTPRTVRSVTSVSRADFAPSVTRSFGELKNLDDTPIAYIVEFENGEGSAILSADNRLDPVVAIYDRYVITEEELVSEIPDPDAWRTPENLYCEEDEEYYLGASEIYKPDDYLGPMIMNKRFVDSYLEGPEYGEVVYEEESEWEFTEDRLLPLLTTRWKQSKPFNLKIGHNYSAGCVAIAVAQIMAFHEYPEDYCNWKLAKQYGTEGYVKGMITETDDDGNETTIIVDKDGIDNELADLSVRVGKGCKVNYGFWGSKESFSTPKRAQKFLKSIGYSGTKRHIGYDADIILSSLRDSCPVFIGGLTPECHGHAWVIDGYGRYENTVKTYRGSELINTKVQKKLLLHCNWGWGGDYDGYFASKVFDAKNPVIEDKEETEGENSDTPETRGENSRNYTWWFRIVTYDKPKSSES
ncbi:MAG: C10 family peptidase [Alistipes sp.]|nr:C10 family peptidase [Alistipes senegalensis]MCM1250627.1 C10 family peptidase [Alistipes sp.]